MQRYRTLPAVQPSTSYHNVEVIQVKGASAYIDDMRRVDYLHYTSPEWMVRTILRDHNVGTTSSYRFSIYPLCEGLFFWHSSSPADVEYQLQSVESDRPQHVQLFICLASNTSATYRLQKTPILHLNNQSQLFAVQPASCISVR
jgi:hypothetical protein